MLAKKCEQWFYSEIRTLDFECSNTSANSLIHNISKSFMKLVTYFFQLWKPKKLQVFASGKHQFVYFTWYRYPKTQLAFYSNCVRHTNKIRRKNNNYRLVRDVMLDSQNVYKKLTSIHLLPHTNLSPLRTCGNCLLRLAV